MAAVESIGFDSRFDRVFDTRFDTRFEVPHGQHWTEHAVCKGRTNLFFPPRAERPQARVRREAQARLICSTCPVQSNCQEFARANHEYGFWGGESEEDRHLAGYTVSAPIGVRARTGVG